MKMKALLSPDTNTGLLQSSNLNSIICLFCLFDCLLLLLCFLVIIILFNFNFQRNVHSSWFNLVYICCILLFYYYYFFNMWLVTKVLKFAPPCLVSVVLCCCVSDMVFIKWIVIFWA